MKDPVTLLDRAKADLFNVNLILKEAVDDVVLDIAAYHCSQCIEKVVKYYMTALGIHWPKEHWFRKLIPLLPETDIVRLSVEPFSELLDEWTDKTRYHSSILSSKKKIEEIACFCIELISCVESKLAKEPVNNE